MKCCLSFLADVDSPTTSRYNKHLKSHDGFDHLISGYFVILPDGHPYGDLVIDLGPENGDKGSELMVAGTPEEVAEYPTSHTAKY